MAQRSQKLTNSSLHEVPCISSISDLPIRTMTDKTERDHANYGSSSSSTNNDMNKNKCRLFVTNLHSSTTEGDLINIFKSFGKVNGVDYRWHKFGVNKGKPKGHAFIDFDTEVAAKKAITASNNPNRIISRGNRLVIRYSNNEGTHPSESSVFTGSSVASNDRTQGHKRGRDEAIVNDDNEPDSQKLKNIRQIEEKMRKLEETLKKMEQS